LFGFGAAGPSLHELSPATSRAFAIASVRGLIRDGFLSLGANGHQPAGWLPNPNETSEFDCPFSAACALGWICDGGATCLFLRKEALSFGAPWPPRGSLQILLSPRLSKLA
jgi:hypothetical protein